MDTGPVRLKKLPFYREKNQDGSWKTTQDHGEYCYDTHEINIDPRFDILISAYHECLHHAYPKWSDEEIEAATLFLVNAVTAREATRFLKEFARRL